MKEGEKVLAFTKQPIVYKCDPSKNKTCAKTECQKRCFYTLNPFNSVDGKRYQFNADTGKEECLDA